jgi:CheY-like chemotaxis protein
MVASARVKRCNGCGMVSRRSGGSCIRCGDTAFSVADVEVVDGRYAIERPLGVGSMGVVHLAWDVDLGREVALKIVHPEYANRSNARDRFRKEAASLAAIRHDNVVQIYAFGAHKDSFFFAMEFVRGATLEAVVSAFAVRRAYVPIHRAITVLLQVASGLAAAHAAGIVHRDVKPSNVLIEARTGRPVLIDFGLAHWARDGAAADSAGTPAYMAPEQCVPGPGADAGPWTDVYAMACTSFFVFANRPPFVAPTAPEILGKQMTELAPRLSTLRSELAALDAVVGRALAKVPSGRFATSVDFREALAEAGAAWIIPAPASDASWPPPPPSETGVVAGTTRVLVVDDDDAFRRFAARAAQLALFGAPLALAAVGTGAQALASAQRHPPQLVLLDFDMPGLDGLATLSELRALPQGHDARVVVVSGRAGIAERWRFSVLGVTDFVQKPVDLVGLVGVIERIATESGWVHRSASEAIP